MLRLSGVDAWRLGSRRSMAAQRKVIEKYMVERLGKRGGSCE